MADNDYICVYRQFFEEFAKTSEMEDCRPMRVNLYDLSIDELIGEVMQSCVNYLVERKCPKSLVVPLTKIVVEEFINEAKKQPEEVNTPLKLNRKTHEKISEVCLRYIDNEKLSSLPEPVQEINYSTHSTKHTRRRMEDRLICLPRFNSLHSIQSNSEAGYFGIFDGHNGVNAACYAVSHLHQFLAESKYYPDDPVQAFHEAFEKTEFKYNLKGDNSGTTVLAILHQPVEKKLTVAWVGDSQAMLVNEDSYVMLIDPHKPERLDERKRIEALGGYIIRAQGVYRVNGGLAISRAIGDKTLKPYISAEAEIRVLNLTGHEHFIVMGCDGLWDVVEPQQVIETVYFEVMKNEGQIDSVARSLVDLAKKNNSTDNISVIVIFLTDPAEINNRSVDVTGHRPKVLHQDGVIMDANFQTNDKSPFNEPGMNGIYETNGNHFNSHMQNESDDDFGPETDVDAVDDVLTSPKNLNPFGKDCWQKTAEECSDKLIELPKNIGNEILKFTEDFTEPAKPVEDNNSNHMESNELKSDMFPVDSMNPFESPVTNNPSETPVTNNPSEASNILSDFADDSNKYVEEINSKKEREDDFTFSNTANESSDLKNDEDLLGKPHEKNAEQDLFSFDSNNLMDMTQAYSCATPQESNMLYNEESNTSKMEEGVEKLTLESPVQKKSASEFGSEFDMEGISSNENNGSQSSEINTTLNKINESSEPTFKTNEEAVDLIQQGVPLDAGGYPPAFCSVTDTIEAEKAFCDFSSMEKSAASKGGDEPSSELLSPSAPAFDGEIKDDTIAESGGEVEESEDDEWNYIKVESGVHQAIPVDSKVSETVLSAQEVSEVEKPTMNSPLNPEADEFIPISAMSTNNEFNTNMTPKKAISDDLTDIIASSPNWNNMNNVSLPEESAFLSEIKSRPSNIFENLESPPQENLDDKTNDMNYSLDFRSPEDKNKENELVNLSQGEPHGLDLASDMTSSFIDPSTMSSDVDLITEKPNLMNSPIEESVTEKQELFLNESVPEVKEVASVEMPSQMSEVLSSAPEPEVEKEVEKVSSPVVNEVMSIPVVVPESSVESGIIDVSQTPTVEVEKSKAVETSQETTPSEKEELVVKPPSLPETLEKSSVEEKTNETVSSNSSEMTGSPAVVTAAAAAATAAVVAASAGVVDKKDVKKSAPKGTSSVTSKPAATSKVLLNGTKTSATMRKPASSAQTAKTSVSGKTTSTMAASATKTTAPKTSITSKAQPKTTTSVSSTNKAPARSRPTSAAVAASKSSPTKTTVTISPTKSSTTTTVTTTSTVTTLKTATKTPVSSPVSLKAKPRVPSATVEKKSTPVLNGDTKTTIKRTELITKRTSGGTTSTTTGTVTRVSLSGRPTSASAKPAALKTTVTTTRNVTAKPRTTLSSITSSTTTTATSKTMPAARKSTVGTDKLAKEVANRLTSKTASVPKTNGVVQKTTNTTVTKTRKTLTTTPTTVSKTKNHDKTENKAEKVLEEKVEIIQNEKGAPLIENINNSNINLIDNMASE